MTVKPKKIELQAYQQYLQPRLRDWHKGLSGHVLVIGGAQGFSGAARMAAMAALRVGAGLVSVATDEISAPTMNIECPELMCHAIMHADELSPLLAKANVVIIGPGLQQSEWAKRLWKLVTALTIPIVVDADALTILASDPGIHANCVLTPHPGEAARLLGVKTSDVQQDRLMSVTKLVERYGSVVVLKGAGSLVAAPHHDPLICEQGNPGMSTAGMGDILSGVIGGLLAQGVPLYEAACLGVVLHATAGDMAAKQGERGMIATDLLPYLRQLCNLNQ